MKLLGWMHRKFRQNSTQASSASACLYCLSGWPSSDDNPPPTALCHELYARETEPPDLTATSFIDGLLSIGTFGSPIVMSDGTPPATKEENSLRAAVYETEEKETKITTESELIAFTIELKKVLTVDSKKGKESDVRNSSAQATNRKDSEIYPMQDFLFRPAVEVLKTTDDERKREGRASLGELLLKGHTVDADERYGSGRKDRMVFDNESLMRTTKEEMQRKFKCRESKCSEKSRGAETKIQNILRIFHRKIHPENSFGAKNFRKPTKLEVKRESKCRIINKIKRNCMDDCGRKIFPPKEAYEEEKLSRFKSHSYQDSRAFFFHNIAGSREQWIKTDADYLVLEL